MADIDRDLAFKIVPLDSFGNVLEESAIRIYQNGKVTGVKMPYGYVIVNHIPRITAEARVEEIARFTDTDRELWEAPFKAMDKLFSHYFGGLGRWRRRG